ncbi:penicillin-binding protein [Candidatus Uhrbacteria bacterium]|nr:penicillin-binding protein [Candidatus Uhrbacteria bacterium]
MHTRYFRSSRSFHRPFWRRFFTSGTLIKNVFTLGVLGGVAGLFILAVLFALYSRGLPDPNQLSSRRVSQSTKIYDRTGEHLLYEVHRGERRTLRKLSEGFCMDDAALETDTEGGIPLFAVEATIAAEDHAFCSHKGFSVRGLARAVIFRGSRGGGSTLTQQLVKNAILTNERSLVRKIKELILSVELERRYSKDEIVQIYFNEIPYGSTNYGIEAAAQAYFGKTAHDLTPAEAATLAALPKAPTTYLNNPDRLKTRRDYILGQMKELKFLTDEEWGTAVAEETPIIPRVGSITAPHFVFYVKEMLERDYGAAVVEEGGLRVTTTIDYERQVAAEEAVRSGVEENGERLGFTNAALVALDPKTGEILSMVGSKDYFEEEIDGSVNVTTRPRQPGSSFKPIVYAAAFEQGYTPNTILWDVNTSFPTVVGAYEPKNYDEKERGPVTMRKALQGSLNTPAVKTLFLVGLERVYEFAKTFGYSTLGDLSNYGPSLALGSAEVTLLEHTNAYATFAREGEFVPTAAILKVEDADGGTLFAWERPEATRTMEPRIAQTISSVLSDNEARTYVFGANSFLQLGDRPVAAKTGTTNDSRDAWLVGYTPSLSVGVWAGNNDNSEMTRGGGASAAGPIWNAFMRKALAGTPREIFPVVEIPLTGKAILDGTVPSETFTIDKVSGKLATEFTPVELRETKSCPAIHDILHYVDVQDPLGPPPDKPEKNEQYLFWESAVGGWVDRQAGEPSPTIVRCTPPTESDTVHAPGLIPQISISPSVNGRFVSVAPAITSPRPVVRVEYEIDNRFHAKTVSFPFQVSFEVSPSIGGGSHELSVRAIDDVGNAGVVRQTITLTEPTRVNAVEILTPREDETISRLDENAYSVFVQVRAPSTFSAILLYAEPRAGGAKTLIGSAKNPNTNSLNFRWTLPADGDWILSAVGERTNGQVETSPFVQVTIR